MRTVLAEMSPEDASREREVYLWAEVARSGCMSPSDAHDALKDELEFMAYLAEAYDLDDSEGWQPDPVSGKIYDMLE